MPRYAIIEDGEVVNIATANEPLAPNWVEAPLVKIGDFYDGTSFISPSGPTITELRADMFKKRGAFALAAARAGIISEAEALSWAGGTSLPASVDAIFDTLPADQQLEARIEALSTQYITRTNVFIVLLQAALGLTDEQADTLFA